MDSETGRCARGRRACELRLRLSRAEVRHAPYRGSSNGSRSLSAQQTLERRFCSSGSSSELVHTLGINGGTVSATCIRVRAAVQPLRASFAAIQTLPSPIATFRCCWRKNTPRHTQVSFLCFRQYRQAGWADFRRIIPAPQAKRMASQMGKLSELSSNGGIWESLRRKVA